MGCKWCEGRYPRFDNGKHLGLVGEYDCVDAAYVAVRDAVRSGALPPGGDREQRVDWTYGNAVASNPSVTREDAERAVDPDPWLDEPPDAAFDQASRAADEAVSDLDEALRTGRLVKW